MPFFHPSVASLKSQVDTGICHQAMVRVGHQNKLDSRLINRIETTQTLYHWDEMNQEPRDNLDKELSNSQDWKNHLLSMEQDVLLKEVHPPPHKIGTCFCIFQESLRELQMEFHNVCFSSRITYYCPNGSRFSRTPGAVQPPSLSVTHRARTTRRSPTPKGVSAANAG
jgi:hypothetical protein